MRIYRLIGLSLLILGFTLGLIPRNLAVDYNPAGTHANDISFRAIPPFHSHSDGDAPHEIFSSLEIDEDEDEKHDNKPVHEGIFTFDPHIRWQPSAIGKLIPVEAFANAFLLRFSVLRL